MIHRVNGVSEDSTFDNRFNGDMTAIANVNLNLGWWF